MFRPAPFFHAAALGLAMMTIAVGAMPAAAAELDYRPGASRAGPPSKVRIIYGVPRRMWHIPQQAYFVDQGPSYDLPGTPYLEPSTAYPDNTLYPYGRSDPYLYGYGQYGGYGRYGYRGGYRHGRRFGHGPVMRQAWRGRPSARPISATARPGGRPAVMKLDGGPRGGRR
jgi:hypothetical protein